MPLVHVAAHCFTSRSRCSPLADRLLTGAAGESRAGISLERGVLRRLCAGADSETVAPEVLFADAYPYYSSFSPALLAHSRENALGVLAERGLTGESLVIELASNDGYFAEKLCGSWEFGVGNRPGRWAGGGGGRIGVPTLRDFFTLEFAERLRAEEKSADVVHANNVLAHVADTNGFVLGLRTILKPDGVAVIEVPYLKSLIEHVEFDTIYHEHLCYFSVTALDHLFRRHGLYLNRIELLKIHGGSLRLFVEPKEQVTDSVKAQLQLERELGLDRFGFLP